MAIKYIHPQTDEAVRKEPWRWAAFYNDGTELRQFEITSKGGEFRPFSSINQDRIVKFVLEHDTYQPITIFPPPGGKVEHFYINKVLRTERVLNDGQKVVDETRIRLYAIGYRLGKERATIQVDELGRIYLEKYDRPD